MFEIKGKVAIVTGGASGIGLSTVEMLLAKGGIPIIADYNEEEGRKQAKRLGIHFIKVDVSKEEEVKQMIETAVDLYGKLHIMVANAGIGYGCPTNLQKTEDWQKVIDINLNGVYYSNKYAIDAFLEHNVEGTIVNVSSILGLVGQAATSAYNATKFAVRGLTKSLAVEFAPKNIRVNSIHPGYVITGMVNEEGMGSETIEMLKTLHPLSAGIGRLGKPEEIAIAVIMVIENSFMTGAEVVIDGGFTCQ